MKVRRQVGNVAVIQGNESQLQAREDKNFNLQGSSEGVFPDDLGEAEIS
jgi:hypothetical protein